MPARVIVLLFAPVLLLGALGPTAHAAPLDRFADEELPSPVKKLPASLVRSGNPWRGPTWVSVFAFYEEAPKSAFEAQGERRGVGGGIELGIALDRLAFGRNVIPSGPRAVPDPTSETESRPASTGGARPPPMVSLPVARACVAAAWRAQRLDDDGRLDAIVSRARASGLLPEARLRALRGLDESASLNTTSDEQRYTGGTGANLALEARLTWRLDRLLYIDDEPTFERIRLERHDTRWRIASRVLDVLFRWQRARSELERATLGTQEEVEAEIRATEAAATLDVLTNGWFGAWLARDEPRQKP
jgi:hypothetical protein